LRECTRNERLTRIGKLPATKQSLLMMAGRFKNLPKDAAMVTRNRGSGAQPFMPPTVVLINEHSHIAAKMVSSFAKGESSRPTLFGTRSIS